MEDGSTNFIIRFLVSTTGGEYTIYNTCRQAHVPLDLLNLGYGQSGLADCSVYTVCNKFVTVYCNSV